MGDDSGVFTRGTSKLAAITNIILDVVDDGTFGHLAEGHAVANLQGRLSATVDELTSIHPFNGDEVFFINSVSNRVAEGHNGDGGTATGVVDDGFDDTLDVTVAFGVIKLAELAGTLAGLVVGAEDASSPLALGPNNLTHVLTKRNGDGGKG